PLRRLLLARGRSAGRPRHPRGVRGGARGHAAAVRRAHARLAVGRLRPDPALPGARRPAGAPLRRRGDARGVSAVLQAPGGVAMPPVLAVEGVRKSFGGVTAVNDVSLSLEPGRIYGLIGPNGSGKTTLFNCITGVDHVDEGEILLKGRRVERLKPHQIFHLGVGRTFQVIRVFPELTALENLLVV